MYELIQAGEQSYYVQCPAKIGIYKKTETEVYLIDSGSDKNAGRRVRKILDQQGWHLKGILNTHSHADHIGGNHYLQQQYGCKIFAEGIEAAFTRHPILEPAFLYGGCPLKGLRHKFLMAAESETVSFSDPEFPREVEVIPLPGHSFDMVGFRLPDGTVFLADSLSSEATLEKYGISFLYDVEAHLNTLEKVSALEARMFVPSHAEASEEIRPLAELNRKKVLETGAYIRELCGEPKTFEEILQKVFQDYGMQMTYQQYALIGSTVRSYLAWLEARGGAEAVIEENRMLWKKTV